MKRIQSVCRTASTRRVHLPRRVPEVLGRHYEIAYPGRQWTSCRDLRRMPLHDLLAAEGAHFGQYAGYERPLYFASRRAPRLSFGKPDWHAQVGREVLAASTGAAVFDQSSLGKIDIRGKGACAFLDRVCANRMDRAPGSVVYSTMLNERGGVESDLTAIRSSVDHFRLHVGTASHGRDLAWLRRQLGDRDDVIIEDVTDSFAILALMGSESGRIAADLGGDALQVLEYFRAGEGASGRRSRYRSETFLCRRTGVGSHHCRNRCVPGLSVPACGRCRGRPAFSRSQRCASKRVSGPTGTNSIRT